MSENRNVQNPASNMPPQRPKKENAEIRKKKNVKTIITIVVVAQVFLAVFVGAFLFRSAYGKAKENTTKQIREAAYDTVYGLTENANHTSNRAAIALDGIREKADLEVLQINTSYLYVSDKEDQSKALTIWYRIPGTGSYTVDLQMTEFVVDSERNHVLVKAPLPVVTKFREELDKVEQLEYKDDRFILKGNTGEGEKIAQKMLYNARSEMVNSLESNREYMDAAKESARKLITNIIRALNPSIKDLSVTVEFADIT